jgi:hypothetical protein
MFDNIARDALNLLSLLYYLQNTHNPFSVINNEVKYFALDLALHKRAWRWWFTYFLLARDALNVAQFVSFIIYEKRKR